MFEAGDAVGASIRQWGHVRVFSPWEYNVDPVAGELLARHGWTAPDGDGYPTGAEIVERYLEPLAAVPAIARSLHLGARVVGVTRLGIDKLKDDGREDAPFELLVDERGNERRYPRQRRDRRFRDMDATEPARRRRAACGGRARLTPTGSRTGSPTCSAPRGSATPASACSSSAAATRRSTRSSTWSRCATRSRPRRSCGRSAAAHPGRKYGGGGDDQLPARGALGATVRRMVHEGTVQLIGGFQVRAIETADGGLRVVDGERSIDADEVIAATGFRPDLALLGELRLDLDDRVEAAAALAPLIDPNLHSCGSVPPHGIDELSHPDSGVYMVGMKSYGRAPTFLLRTGYEQVRSVVAALAGDWDAARRVELVLPETGVCSRSAAPEPTETAGAACCGTGSPHAETATA